MLKQTYAPHQSNRLSNWDLLRTVSMFLVLVIHSTSMLDSVVKSHVITIAINEALLLCDPVFFCLSGYFSIKPLKGSYLEYLSKKFRTVLVPIIIYIIPIYIYEVYLGREESLKSFVAFHHEYLFSEWWFIPELIPFLIIAPLLYVMLEQLSDVHIRLAIRILFITAAWGAISTIAMQVFMRM